MIEVIPLTLGPMACNCYLAYCPETLAAVIIDPADSGETINQTILDHQLQPQAIILTHGHCDHVMGLLECKLAWQIPILANAADQFLLDRLPETAQKWFGWTADPAPAIDQNLGNQQEISFGKETLTVEHTPGHTPGSVILYNDDLVFVGDLAFADGYIGRTDFSYSDQAQMQESLKKLSKHTDKTAFPGHGPAFQIA
jgi:hydroxyacylglutathione hydrolase